MKVKDEESCISFKEKVFRDIIHDDCILPYFKCEVETINELKNLVEQKINFYKQNNCSCENILKLYLKLLELSTNDLTEKSEEEIYNLTKELIQNKETLNVINFRFFDNDIRFIKNRGKFEDLKEISRS